MKGLRDQLREWNKQSNQAKKKHMKTQKEKLSTRVLLQSFLSEVKM